MESFTTKEQGYTRMEFFVTSGNAVRFGQDTSLSAKHHRCRGIALAWTAIVILAILLLVGLSLDTARLCLVNHQLQNGADAGALAGAQFVKFNKDGARNMAVTTAAENFAEQLTISVDNNLSNDPSGELVLGRWIRQLRLFIPTMDSPTAVKVVGRRLGQRENAPQVSYIFGPLANVFSGGIERRATAWSQGSTGAGIITLAEYPEIYASEGYTDGGTGLRIRGVLIDLQGVNPYTGEPITGDIQVNAQSEGHPWAALRVDGGSAEIWAGELNISGTSRPDADDTRTWDRIYGDPEEPFSVNPDRDPIPDPLLSAVAPDVGAMPPPRFTNVIDDAFVATHPDTVTEVDPATGRLTNVLTLSPGYYPGGINITGAVDANSPDTKVVLTGGEEAVYAFAGGHTGKSGLAMTGGMLVGNGVMIYITGDATYQWGKIDIHGNTVVQITSRGDAMDPPQINREMGIAIWQDRDNPTYGKIIGGGDMSIIGTIYCGYNPLEIGGNSNQMGNQLIAGALNLHGNAPIRIAYDGRNGYFAFESILVE